jgi:acetylornithine deacetylase/succinyl-diaminopimelate desuccinylase-like protein
VPVVARLVKTLKCIPLMMGVSLPDDNIHAPNEHFRLEGLEKGFLVVSRTIEHLALNK